MGIGPILVLPLLAQSQLSGVSPSFAARVKPPFDKGDEDRLATVADLAALALWKAHLLEEAQSADAAKTSLLATLSHELRTPLAALEGYGELLEDEILGPLSPQQRDVLVRLRTVGRHLGALIEDILTYASLEAERLSVRVAAVGSASWPIRCSRIVEPLAREKGIGFRLELEAGLPDAPHRRSRLRQILLNLVQNAVKFTEHGEVTLRVSHGSPAAEAGHTVRFCRAGHRHWYRPRRPARGSSAPFRNWRTCSRVGIAAPVSGSTSAAASPRCWPVASRWSRVPAKARSSRSS